jgi:peptidoglycan-associated lipoprotein
MNRYALVIALLVLVAATSAFAQTTLSPSEVAYWVNYWSHPPAMIFGPDQEDFYKNVQIILFPYNDHDEPSNPSALDDNARWLKDHPNVRFYVDGYASSRGEMLYNMALSQRRAEWVKRELVKRGVAENRIVVAAGWGELYPVCPEANDECWTKNRLVRLQYTP